VSISDARYCEGIEEAKAKVVAFLEANVRAGVETEGDVMIRLVQKAKTGEQDIDEFPYSPDEPIGEVAQSIVDVATATAMQWTGKTRFAIRVVGRVRVQTFTLDVPKIEEDEDDDLHDFEENNSKKGLLGQLMRHNEVGMKLAVTAAKHGREELLSQNRELQQRVDNLTKQLFEQRKHYEEVLDRQFMRDMELRKFEADEKRKEMVAGGLMMAGKMIANNYLLKQGVPLLKDGTPSPFEAMGEGLFSSLEKDPERMMKLAEFLTPMEQATLLEMQRYRSEMAAARAAAEEAAEKAAQAGQNGGGPAASGPPVNASTYTPWTP
jgi:hypothetical protein